MGYKPRTNLVLVSREPLFYLEFNKPNKQNVSEINLFKKFNFFMCQNNCWHTDWLQEWNIKTSLLKIDKIKYITLLSDANVRFRAQQRAKYSWPQLMQPRSQGLFPGLGAVREKAPVPKPGKRPWGRGCQLTVNSIAAKMCLWHFI